MPPLLHYGGIMKTETWKDIPGYEGKYQVSNLGRVKSLSRLINGANQFSFYAWTSRERILRPGRHDKGGHLSIMLNSPRKCCLVHQLVVRAFVGEKPEGNVVLHVNGDPCDNRLENLRYDTQSENVLDVYRQGKAWKKLSIDDVEAIRFGLACGISCSDLGRMYNVGRQAISKIKNEERYQWLK